MAIDEWVDGSLEQQVPLCQSLGNAQLQTQVRRSSLYSSLWLFSSSIIRGVVALAHTQSLPTIVVVRCRGRIIVAKGDYHIGMFASRPIKAGEELMFHYHMDRHLPKTKSAAAAAGAGAGGGGGNAGSVEVPAAVAKKRKTLPKPKSSSS